MESPQDDCGPLVVYCLRITGWLLSSKWYLTLSLVVSGLCLVITYCHARDFLIMQIFLFDIFISTTTIYYLCQFRCLNVLEQSLNLYFRLE